MIHALSLSRGMLLVSDKEAMKQAIIIESINTGRTWRMDEVEINLFMRGRRPEFYRIWEAY